MALYLFVEYSPAHASTECIKLAVFKNDGKITFSQNISWLGLLDPVQDPFGAIQRFVDMFWRGGPEEALESLDGSMLVVVLIKYVEG
ncbi:unnamed protein product [Fusarium graminearum]|nr:unnamed protein product [Fusarium graminearum]